MSTGAKVKVDDLFAYGFVVLYKLPGMMGYGDHWELSKEESKQLGASLKACIETIPEERKKRITRKVENFLPWVALFAFGGVMTYQRVMITRMMLAQERHKRVYNIEDKTAETASPIADLGDLNAKKPFGKPSSGDNRNQSGASFSGGKDIPLPFIVPE